MKTKNNMIVMLFVLCLVDLSCTLDRNPLTPEARDASVIMPLEIGDRWIFDVTDFDSTCSVLKRFVDTLVIVGDKVINGQRWYVTNEGCIVRNSPEGLWSALLVDGEISNLTLAAKYPGSTGERWYYGYATIVSADMVLKVPYGEFHCYKYEDTMNLEDTPSVSYLAPGVGILRAEYYRVTSDGRSYMYEVAELKDVIMGS